MCGSFGNIVSGVFTPVLAKHSKSFSLVDCISVGVDRMQLPRQHSDSLTRSTFGVNFNSRARVRLFQR